MKEAGTELTSHLHQIIAEHVLDGFFIASVQLLVALDCLVEGLLEALRQYRRLDLQVFNAQRGGPLGTLGPRGRAASH